MLLPVCQAIQHAHQKGIIHRGIKPSNILVAEYDQQPVPKVIDFGVAKAVSQPLTEKTMFTGLGQIVGTLAYMSPEQAGVNQLDIDTRSDIYSLGVLTYELLTGTTPFDKQRLRSAAWDDMLRIIREEEPPKPSTRLSDSQHSQASISAERHTEPARLTKLVRGELDWIVMRALEKDRTRRYETANGFARDIEHFLNHEPVSAGPPTMAYRLRKFVMRNRAQVVAGSLVLLALVAGMIGTTMGLIEARRQAGLAHAEANEKERAREAAEAERKKAIEFRDKALDALWATTGTDVEKLIGQRKELGANERAYLEAIAQRWQTFARQEGTDTQSRAVRGEAHFRVGLLWYQLGRRDEARPEYEQAMAIREQLAAEFPAVPEYRNDLATSHNNLGVLLADLGKWAEAEEQYRKGLAIHEKLAPEFPAVPDYRVELGGSYCNFGNLVRDSEHVLDSLPWYQKAIALLEPIHRAQLRHVTARRFLRNSHLGRATAYAAIKNHAEALRDWERAIELTPPLERGPFRAERAFALLHAGQVAEAVAQLADLTSGVEWTAAHWYNFACIYSVASGKIADKKQGYADRAMQMLKKAVQAGWEDAAHMEQDTDLDPLRDRDDFKQLVESLDAATPATMSPIVTPTPPNAGPAHDRESGEVTRWQEKKSAGERVPPSTTHRPRKPPPGNTVRAPDGRLFHCTVRTMIERRRTCHVKILETRHRAVSARSNRGPVVFFADDGQGARGWRRNNS